MASDRELSRRRMEISRRRFVIGSLGLTGLAVLGACGVRSTDSTASGSRAGPSGAAGPRRGGALRVAEFVPSAFYIGTSFDLGSHAWIQMSWPLFYGSPHGFDLISGLAESHEFSPDGLTHTITLRSGMTFHDGSPIDAQAVAENYRAVAFPDSPLRDDGPYGMAPIAFGDPIAVKSIDVVDELRLSMAFDVPRGDIRPGLGLIPIGNPKVLARENYGTDVGALRDLGSGPFRMTSFTPNAYVEFERFESFFEPALLDNLRLEYFPDAAAAGVALRGGSLDVALGLGKADLDEFAADPAYELIVADPPSTIVEMEFSTPKKPELKDVRVREAIILALNRAAYVDAFFTKGTAQLATQPIVAPGTAGYNKGLEARPYDPDRAKALLAEAGAANFTLDVLGWPAGVKPIDEAIAADLAAVGIDARFTKADLATYIADRDAKYDVGLSQLPNGPDPLDNFGIFFYGGALGDAADPRMSPNAQGLLNQARETIDPEERAQLLQELMQLEHDELIMGVPIALTASVAAARTAAHVRDFRISPGEIDPHNHAWIDTA